MKRTALLAFFMALVAVPGAWAQDKEVDLRADSLTVSPLSMREPYFVTLYMTNLGPDTLASKVSITVDIDDPTKPGGTRLDATTCQFSHTEEIDLLVPLPVGGSIGVTLTYAFPPCPGIAERRVTASVAITEPGYIDPFPNNNSVTRDVWFVVPSVTALGLAVLVGLLMAMLIWGVRRRRQVM